MRLFRRKIPFVTFLAATAMAAASLAASPGAASATPASTVVTTATQTVDDTVVTGIDSFAYSGSWGTASGVSDLYDGTCHWDNNTGDTATFTFLGTEAVIHGVKDVDQGIATYSVDGGAATTVDDYSATRDAQAALFDTGALPLGLHTVTITTTGQQNAASTFHTIAIDYAVFTGPTSPWLPLAVNLAPSGGKATGVGEGFLYGISQDGTQPADKYLKPLGITSYRGGGWVNSGAWVRDGYAYGANTQGNVATVIAQARRLTKPPYHAQYQALLSDIWGANGGQPWDSVYPCTNGDCSNWVTFIKTVVTQLQATGLKFAYDIWNEPDIGVFWPNGATDTPQYFAMWDSAYKEIHAVAPKATIVGPDFGWTPERYPAEWTGFLAHVQAAGTVPDMITNHDEGDEGSTIDDPVTVGQAINADQAAAGITPLRPLSANEYQPADRQDPGTTAWYLARFAQSGYTNAMRGNWVCCLDPNLAGTLTSVNGTYRPNGNWWAMRAYADMTGGTLLSTTGQIGTTAISAALVKSDKRAVAIVGDWNGFTGDVQVTFNGLSSAPWLSKGKNVQVTVYRIPNQAPLSAPQVVLSQTMSTTSGSITVPVNFQTAGDAFAVYLSKPGDPGSEI